MVATHELGRDAVKRHAWADAVEAFTKADRDGDLSPDDLELLGRAAWWAGKPDDATDALERAFAGFESADRPEDAARVGMTLAYEASRRMANAVFAGWIARVMRLLERLPDSPLQANAAAFAVVPALMGGQYDEGIQLADRAIDLARAVGNEDALYMALGFKGAALTAAGRWHEGLAILDEAAAAASSGRLDLRTASDILCMTIGSCRNVGDLDRAAQWADQSERWMRREGAGGYPGICRVHKAEIKMLHGRWSEAEQEARQACSELERFRLTDSVGFAQNAVGEVRLRMGDLDGAEEAFERAYEFGHDGQPGISLLRLARGDVAEARRSIERALTAALGSGTLTDRAARARLLPAQVDIALAARDFEKAEAAVTELEQIAVDFEQPFFRAGALTARGELLLGEDPGADGGRDRRRPAEQPHRAGDIEERFVEGQRFDQRRDVAQDRHHLLARSAVGRTVWR